MKTIICRSFCVIVVIFIAALADFAQSQTSNSISGFVFDERNRIPVAEAYVELLDDVYTTLRRTKTDGSGRFFFGGISAGNFKVKVLPYGTNYLEDIQDATITNYSFGNARTSDRVYLDIYLKLDKRKINIGESTPVEAVFVQDIPGEARNLYKKGTAQLENAKQADQGLENLKKALSISPDYYDALNRLGVELLRRKKHSEAIPYLIKAINVNQRSFSGFYALGLAAVDLRSMSEAINAFRATTIINPQSIYAQTKYGMVLRINGNYKEAEQALLKAKALDKDVKFGDLYWQLGLLYDKTQRYGEAADELEKFLKIQSDVSNLEQIKSLIAQLRAKAKK